MTHQGIAATLLAGALVLAGCDGGEPSQDVRQIKVANPHHDQLQALSEPMRMLGLMRAIRDSGNRCKRVDAGAYQEDHRGLAMWVARCSDSGHWGVFIAPNADIQVRSCAHMAQLDLPRCRQETLYGQGEGEIEAP
jgi:hypothetical protein